MCDPEQRLSLGRSRERGGHAGGHEEGHAVHESGHAGRAGGGMTLAPGASSGSAAWMRAKRLGFEI